MNCDMPSVYNEHKVKARRDHQCCECRGKIKKGEEYTLSKGCWDGSWSDYKTCADCSHLRCETSAEMDSRDCGIPFGNLYEFVADSEKLLAAFQAIQKERGYHFLKAKGGAA